VLLVLLALLVMSTVANVALVQHERATTKPYGQRIPVEGGMVNVVDHDAKGPTIVLLSGLGTPAPGLDFGPLIRELAGYRVVVVEGFGYDYSDMQGPARTTQNVSQEVHAALVAAGVQAPYVLGGHSLPGFYILDYVNRYPEEVSAVIGIDTTVPVITTTQDSTPVAEDGGIPWERLPASTGLLRWLQALAPDLVPGLALPEHTAHTDQEREQIHRMTIWNFGNQAVTDEWRRVGNNARRLEDVGFPEELPVLAFVAQETIEHNPRWLPLHEEQLHPVRDHQIVVLEGPHYLHWTRSPEMASAITAFLQEHELIPHATIMPAASPTAG
jgi:pimeloyl-ACP methyl ester carboxylesterase